MYAQCLVAEFRNRKNARACLEILGKAGFEEEAVSLVSRADDPHLEELGLMQDDGAENIGSSKGAGLGALLGGVVTAPLAVGSLIGPFFLVGPLVGVGLGAAIGGVLGKAQQWGVNESARKEYEEKVKQGAVLIFVTGDEGSLREAEASMVTTEPASIHRFASSEN